jgi:hypothetical protein
MPTAELSAAQLAANQNNALKSTGPRTGEGKSVARYNARRHGLTGQFSCMSEGDEVAYKAFEAGIFVSLKPVGAYETQVAICITQNQWRLNRSRGVENNIYGRGHDRFSDLLEADSPAIHAAGTMADTQREESRIFSNIALYETRIHRMIDRDEKRLGELQAERKAAETLAFEEAELLVRYADFTNEPLTEVDLASNAENPDAVEVDGFVFSAAKIRAKISRDRDLANARKCASLNWDRAILEVWRDPSLLDVA